ncbi:hypothetical protein NDU88_004539 [Pleurodeles waltl]|uniref:Uncharacterized protein n=1 Tax=Pleurodeles waltl TaxID=8319 RepID=A0AAV7LPK7_PLEWA|nr:hypothetical protein NDU88_004539 [Pleurodeles waltl]
MARDHAIKRGETILLDLYLMESGIGSAYCGAAKPAIRLDDLSVVWMAQGYLGVDTWYGWADCRVGLAPETLGSHCCPPQREQGQNRCQQTLVT